MRMCLACANMRPVCVYACVRVCRATIPKMLFFGTLPDFSNRWNSNSLSRFSLARPPALACFVRLHGRSRFACTGVGGGRSRARVRVLYKGVEVHSSDTFHSKTLLLTAITIWENGYFQEVNKKTIKKHFFTKIETSLTKRCGMMVVWRAKRKKGSPPTPPFPKKENNIYITRTI